MALTLSLFLCFYRKQNLHNLLYRPALPPGDEFAAARLSLRCPDLPCVALDPSTSPIHLPQGRNSVRTGTLPCSAWSPPRLLLPSDSQQPWEVGSIPTPIENGSKPNHREVMNLVQCTKAGDGQSRATNPGSLTPESAGESTRKRPILVNCRPRTFSSDEIR